MSFVWIIRSLAPLPGAPMFRPVAMRIDRARCIHCELCYAVAPVIRDQPERIPVTGETLEAMAACPFGAIVWREDLAPIPELPERNPT